MSEFVAPDGESYYVMALYFAANRWGSGTGIYNYKAEADRLLTNLRHRALITRPVFMSFRGTNSLCPVTAGPLFDAEHKMVLFSPSSERPPFTDPSYHLPAFYELWARWGPPADQQFLAGGGRASRDFFPRAAHPVTALAPDYANFDGTPHAGSWNTNAADFRFDAWRMAMNWSVDWAWWGKDAREKQLSDRLQAFFESRGLSNYGNQFTLDGKQLQSDIRGIDGHECRGQPCGHEPARPTVRGGVMDMPKSRQGSIVTTTDCCICWACCIAAVSFASGLRHNHPFRMPMSYCVPAA